ncbi:hypothetical protein F5Y12DRAFT_148729 [Xylaria sp. FL1777]|nr:hypothetical protein F5Y12DRAFT_148729 [Xylaria sp. FL1777]
MTRARNFRPGHDRARQKNCLPTVTHCRWRPSFTPFFVSFFPSFFLQPLARSVTSRLTAAILCQSPSWSGWPVEFPSILSCRGYQVLSGPSPPSPLLLLLLLLRCLRSGCVFTWIQKANKPRHCTRQHAPADQRTAAVFYSLVRAVPVLVENTACDPSTLLMKEHGLLLLVVGWTKLTGLA